MIPPVVSLLFRAAPLPAAALFLFSPIAAQAADLAVTISNVRNAQGVVRLCLLSQPSGFPNCAPPNRKTAVPATPPAVHVAFADVPAGRYAITAYHDEQGVGHLRTNLLGIPRDGVGASNDPRPRFGPPSYGDSVFEVGPQGGAISFALVYP